MKRCWWIVVLCAAGCLMPTPDAPVVPVNPVNPPPPVPVNPVDPNGPQAWVITETLPDPGPSPNPQTPFVPQDEQDMEPVPSSVCSCGCAQTNCHCGRNAQSACPVAMQAAAASGPVLTVDDTALEFAKSQAGNDAVIAYAPPWCHGPCATWEAMIGTGDATLRVEWRHEEFPADVRAQTRFAPAFVYRGKVLWQSPVGQTLATMKARVREMQGTQGQIVGALTIGTIRGRAPVAKLLDAVTRQRTGESVLAFGPASIILPPRMRSVLDITPDATRFSFDGNLPLVKYGSGLLSVSRPVRFIEATRELITINVDGFPDLSFRLE